MLVDVWRGKPEFPELVKVVQEQAERWRPRMILIEDAASGQSLIQSLRRFTMLPILPIKVDRDKVTRAQAATPWFETGRVWFRADAPWLGDLEAELEYFPTGQHDDQVDSVTQYLNFVQQYGRRKAVKARVV